MTENPYKSPRELGDNPPEPVWVSICDWHIVSVQGLWFAGVSLVISIAVFLTLPTGTPGGLLLFTVLEGVSPIGFITGVVMVGGAQTVAVLRSKFRE